MSTLSNSQSSDFTTYCANSWNSRFLKSIHYTAYASLSAKQPNILGTGGGAYLNLLMLSQLPELTIRSYMRPKVFGNLGLKLFWVGVSGASYQPPWAVNPHGLGVDSWLVLVCVKCYLADRWLHCIKTRWDLSATIIICHCPNHLTLHKDLTKSITDSVSIPATDDPSTRSSLSSSRTRTIILSGL